MEACIVVLMLWNFDDLPCCKDSKNLVHPSGLWSDGFDPGLWLSWRHRLKGRRTSLWHAAETAETFADRVVSRFRSLPVAWPHGSKTFTAHGTTFDDILVLWILRCPYLIVQDIDFVAYPFQLCLMLMNRRWGMDYMQWFQATPNVWTHRDTRMTPYCMNTCGCSTCHRHHGLSHVNHLALGAGNACGFQLRLEEEAAWEGPKSSEWEGCKTYTHYLNQSLLIFM